MTDYNLTKKTCLKLTNKLDMNYCTEDFMHEFLLKRIEGKTNRKFYHVLLRMHQKESRFCNLDSIKEASYIPNLDEKIDCELMLNKLDTRSSKILYMKYMKQMTDKEIAKIYNISHTTVRNIASLGIIRLQEITGV